MVFESKRSIAWAKWAPVNTHDDSSDAGVDEGFNELATGLSPHQRRPLVRCISKLLFYAFIIAAILVGADQYAKFRVKSICQDKSTTSLDASAHETTLKDPVGFISSSVKTFEAHEDYMAPYSNSTDIWDGLLPPGRGFVFVAESSSYGLAPGQETQWGEIYSVALFHQLHCLGLLRKQYWTLMNTILSHDLSASLEVAAKQQANHHTGHCFDYLRQSIMCAGDMSMEWPRDEVDGSKRIHVDGWGIPHVCKDWDTIWDYMMVNKFNASKHAEIAL